MHSQVLCRHDCCNAFDIVRSYRDRQDGHLAVVRYIVVMMGMDRGGEQLNLSEPGGLYAERVPGLCCGFDAAAHRAVGDIGHRSSSPAGVIR